MIHGAELTMGRNTVAGSVLKRKEMARLRFVIDAVGLTVLVYLGPNIILYTMRWIREE